jgi:hypothetical protein
MLKVRTWTNNKPLRNIAMASTKAANATAVPYVVGFVLSPMQLRTVANKLLKAEVLAMCATDHDYQCHLIDYCYAHKVPWTFLPDKYKESREDYYLWIVRVVPSWDGKHPKATLPSPMVAQVKQMFDLPGVVIGCRTWPALLCRESFLGRLCFAYILTL